MVALKQRRQSRTTSSSTTKSSDSEDLTTGPNYAENSTLYNLYLLGRIPFAFEGSVWCLFGSILFYAKYGSLSLPTVLLSCGLVLLTCISVNYANEFFDFEADKFTAQVGAHGSHGGSKMLIEGVFPKWVALACAGAIQGFILLCIAASRVLEGDWSSVQGVVLWFGLISMFAAQQYVGPPLRLHYNGGGEIISAFELSAGPLLYGYLSQLTVLFRRGLSLQEAYDLTSPSLRLFLLWAFAFELARIWVMHSADITEDRLASKHTLVSMLGYAKTMRLYEFTLLVSLILAWNVLLTSPKSAFLLVPVLGYALPIGIIVRKKLAALIPQDDEGKAGFELVPVLVSLETLATPALLSLITLILGDCLP